MVKNIKVKPVGLLQLNLRKNITFKTNGSLIARVKNKDEYINGSILEIEKIDNTAPSVALGYDKNTLTTNKIDLVATCTDDESGISKYLFKFLWRQNQIPIPVISIATFLFFLFSSSSNDLSNCSNSFFCSFVTDVGTSTTKST